MSKFIPQGEEPQTGFKCDWCGVKVVIDLDLEDWPIEDSWPEADLPEDWASLDFQDFADDLCEKCAVNAEGALKNAKSLAS